MRSSVGDNASKSPLCHRSGIKRSRTRATSSAPGEGVAGPGAFADGEAGAARRHGCQIATTATPATPRIAGNSHLAIDRCLLAIGPADSASGGRAEAGRELTDAELSP